MTIYLVRRHDGTYRAHGSYSYWTDDMQDARVYAKLGPAKALVTRWQRENPDEVTPTLLMMTFDAADMHVVDLSESTSKAIARIQRRKLERQKTQIAWELETLTRKQTEIAQRLAALRPL